MFNIGFGEMVVLAVIALIFIGPKQLPEVARVVGRMLNDLKRAGDDITGSFVKTRDNVDTFLKTSESEVNKKLSDVTQKSEVEQLPEKKDES